MPTRFKNFNLFLTVAGIIGYPTISKSSSFEPVCQVSENSGFCRPAPSVPLLSTPATGKPPYALKDFGTYRMPFSVSSLWNIRPTKVMLGGFPIPTSDYFPLVGTGQYSTAAFEAKPTDLAVTVYPPAGGSGVWHPDMHSSVPFITIPHWPAETVPASGTDGHADIVDDKNGIIHSFWQLKKTDGRWTATQYAWSRLDGRGWGDGVHYFQGARAAGLPPLAGLIRKHEINDGASQYFHALAMSMTFNGMSGVQQYVFPATSGDTTFRENTGYFPTGALMMLPPTFDETKITNADLKKVVKTLKTYGAYVVDRNHGTPFYIYVENGTDYTLHRGGWSSASGNELQKVRAELRQVMYARDWVNMFGQPVTRVPEIGILTMRGTWRPIIAGTPQPRYESMTQSVVYGPTDRAYAAEMASDRSLSHVNWAKAVRGQLYEFKVAATGGGKAYLRYWGGGAEQFNTRALGDGQSFRFVWPQTEGASILGVISGIGNKTSIRATLTPVFD